MSRRRWVLRGMVAFLGVVVFGVGWGLSRLRTQGLADRLAREVQSLPTGPFPRPVAGAVAVPGTFADAAVAPLATLTEALRRAPDAEVCRAVREGDKPWAEVTPLCTHALEQSRAPLHGLLHATDATSAAPLPGWGALEGPERASSASRDYGVVLFAAKLAALELRERLAAGDVAGAMEDCVGLLGLARDLSYGTSTLGRGVGIGVSDRAFRGCVAVADAGSPGVKEALRHAVQAVEQGMPAFQDTVRAWSVATLLRGFGAFLGPRLGTLPLGAQRIAQTGSPPRSFSPRETFWLKDFWHRAQDRMDGFVEASGFSLARRFAALDALGSAQTHAFNPIGREAYPDIHLLALVDQRSRDELGLLRCAIAVDTARSGKGAWPKAADLPVADCGENPGPRYRLEEKKGALELTDSAAARGDLTVVLHPGP